MNDDQLLCKKALKLIFVAVTLLSTRNMFVRRLISNEERKMAAEKETPNFS